MSGIDANYCLNDWQPVLLENKLFEVPVSSNPDHNLKLLHWLKCTGTYWIQRHRICSSGLPLQ